MDSIAMVAGQSAYQILSTLAITHDGPVTGLAARMTRRDGDGGE